jgi:hypothetical protein
LRIISTEKAGVNIDAQAETTHRHDLVDPVQHRKLPLPVASSAQ